MMNLPKNYSHTKLYRAYHHMKDRCMLKTDKNYMQYGGRGITVCDEWLGKDGFKNFYFWSINNGYDDKLTLDRIDVNGNYEPDNCRWTDWFGQARNRTNSNIITINGETKTLTEWAEQYGIRQDTLWRRIYEMGMNPEAAVSVSHLKKREDVTIRKCKDLYLSGMSKSEIARKLNCSFTLVSKRLKD